MGAKTALFNGAVAALSVASLFSEWESIQRKNELNPSGTAMNFFGTYTLFTLKECQTSNNVLPAGVTYNLSNTAADCAYYNIGSYPAPTEYERTFRTFNAVVSAFTVAGTAVALMTAWKSLSAMVKGALGSAPCPDAVAKSNFKWTALSIIFWILSWAPFCRIVADDKDHYPGADVAYGPGFALSVIVCGLSMLLAGTYWKASKAPVACCNETCSAKPCGGAVSWFTTALGLAVTTCATAVASMVSNWMTVSGKNAIGSIFHGTYTLWAATECDAANFVSGLASGGAVALDCQEKSMIDYGNSADSKSKLLAFNSVTAAFTTMAVATSAIAAFGLAFGAFKAAGGHKAALTGSCGLFAPIKALYASLSTVAMFLVAWPVYTRITLDIVEMQQTEAMGREWNYGPGFVLAVIATVSSLLTAIATAKALGKMNAAVPAWIIKALTFSKPATDAAELAKDCAASKARTVAAKALLLAAATFGLSTAALFSDWVAMTVTAPASAGAAAGKMVSYGEYGLVYFKECSISNWNNVAAGAEGLDCSRIQSDKYNWSTAPSNQHELENTTAAFTVLSAFTALVGFVLLAVAFAGGKATALKSYAPFAYSAFANIAFPVIAWAAYTRSFQLDMRVAEESAAAFGAGYTGEVEYEAGYALIILAWASAIISSAYYLLVVKKALKAAEAPALPVKAADATAAPAAVELAPVAAASTEAAGTAATA